MKIIHLEDEAIIRRVVLRTLRGANVMIYPAERCVDAIHLMDLEDIDILISDWELKGSTAQLAIQEASTRGIPVLLFSGSVEEARKVVEVDATMSKGTSIGDLLNVLERMVEASK